MYFLFSPGGFCYVRPPSIRSRADYGGHAAERGGGRLPRKTLLNLIQVYLPYIPICPWIPQALPTRGRSVLAKVARQQQGAGTAGVGFQKTFPRLLKQIPSKRSARNSDDLSRKIKNVTKPVSEDVLAAPDGIAFGSIGSFAGAQSLGAWYSQITKERREGKEGCWQIARRHHSTSL